MSKQKAGERLPYLLGKLKAPRVLERLEQTAALARGAQRSSPARGVLSVPHTGPKRELEKHRFRPVVKPFLHQG